MKVKLHKVDQTRPIKALLDKNSNSLIFPAAPQLADHAKSVHISGVTSEASLRYDRSRTLEKDLKLNPDFVPLYEGDSITITF